MPAIDLDRIDLQLLAQLQQAGRQTNAELAERVHLSPSACLRRVQRLEEEGFIEVLDVDQPPKPLVRPINEYGLSMQMFFDSDFGKLVSWMVEDASCRR